MLEEEGEIFLFFRVMFVVEGPGCCCCRSDSMGICGSDDGGGDGREIVDVPRFLFIVICT